MPCLRLASLCLAFFIAVGLLAPKGFAQPGTLDPSFGNGGIVVIEDAQFDGVDIQADGNVVAVGRTYQDSEYPEFSSGAVWRFLQDGSPDASFGDGGQGETIGGGLLWARFDGVHAHSGGGLFAAGSRQVRDMTLGLLAKYESDGQRDPDFEGGGPLGAAIDERDDGRLLVFGLNGNYFFDPEVSGCWITEHTLDGSGTASYGVTLADLTELGLEWRECRGGSLLGDGTTVLYIDAYDPDVGLRRGATVRFRADGVLEGSYGDDGVSLTPPGVEVTAGAAGLDGSVVLGGLSGDTPAVLRLTSEGLVDPVFGEEGVATLPELDAGTIRAIVQQSDGKLVLAGKTDGSPFVARLLADGRLDLEFGVDGVAILDVGTAGTARALVLDGSGRVVVVGTSVSNAGFVARLIGDGAVSSEPATHSERFALAAPAPNPATGLSTLAYTLGEPSPIRLAVYDVLGREVDVLTERYHAAGVHEVVVDTGRLAPGLYVVRLTAGREALSRRLTVLH